MGRAWVILKLAYLYAQYFLVGLVEDGFQIQKAQYLCELGQYAAAAKAYERALEETNAPVVVASLGYCYLCMSLPGKAAKHLRGAYARRPDPEWGVLLLEALRRDGRTSEAADLYRILSESRDQLSEDARVGLETYEAAATDALGRAEAPPESPSRLTS